VVDALDDRDQVGDLQRRGITNRCSAARRSQNSWSQYSIEAPAPMISRIAGSAGSPKVCTQRSTQFARTIFSPDFTGSTGGLLL